MHAMHASLVLQDGLTFGEIVADIPHDAAAIFMYLLLAVAIGAIVIGSMRSGRKAGRP